MPRRAALHHRLVIGAGQKIRRRGRANRPAPVAAPSAARSRDGRRPRLRPPPGGRRAWSAPRNRRPCSGLRSSAPTMPISTISGIWPQRVQIARRKQVAGVAERRRAAIHQQLVRQAAGLRALAAVGAAPAPGFRGKTLPGIGHAQRAVHEDLQLALRRRADGAHSASESSRASVTRVAPRLLRQPHAVGVGHAHLRAGVDLQIRRDRRASLAMPKSCTMMASAPASAMLASARAASASSWSNTSVLKVTYPRTPRRCRVRHRLRQFVQRKSHLGPRREVLQSEIHRIRAGFDGRAQLRPVSRRTHDFGLAHGWFQERGDPLL